MLPRRAIGSALDRKSALFSLLVRKGEGEGARAGPTKLFVTFIC
jgi:hypothetical protein